MIDISLFTVGRDLSVLCVKTCYPYRGARLPPTPPNLVFGSCGVSVEAGRFQASLLALQTVLQLCYLCEAASPVREQRFLCYSFCCHIYSSPLKRCSTWFFVGSTPPSTDACCTRQGVHLLFAEAPDLIVVLVKRRLGVAIRGDHIN